MNAGALAARLNAYEKLIRLDKPIGTLLLLWPTLWAVWIASEGAPNLVTLWVFILGTLLMRSAGCAVNDFADRQFDAHVARTRDRPLAAGVITAREALIVAGVLALIAFVMALAYLKPFTIALSFVAVFLAASYPFTKRFLPIPQLYLGLAFSFGVLMAFAETQGRLPLVAWVLFAANVCWTLVYDTAYAMVDEPDDRRLGIHTAAILFAPRAWLAVAVSGALAVALWVAVGMMLRFSLWYYLALAAAAVLMAWHVLRLKRGIREDCFRVFKENNLVGLLVFVGVVAHYALASL